MNKAISLIAILLISLGSGILIASIAIKYFPQVEIELPQGSMIPLHSTIASNPVPFRNIVVHGWVNPVGCNVAPQLVVYYKLKLEDVSLTDWTQAKNVVFTPEIACDRMSKFSFRISGDELSKALGSASNLKMDVYVLIIKAGDDPSKYENAAILAGSFRVYDLKKLESEAKDDLTQLKNAAMKGDINAKAQLEASYFDKYAYVFAAGQQDYIDAYKKALSGELVPEYCTDTGDPDWFYCKSPFWNDSYVIQIRKPGSKVYEPIFTRETRPTHAVEYKYLIKNEIYNRKLGESVSLNGKDYHIVEKRVSAGTKSITVAQPLYDCGYQLSGGTYKFTCSNRVVGYKNPITYTEKITWGEPASGSYPSEIYQPTRPESVPRAASVVQLSLADGTKLNFGPEFPDLTLNTVLFAILLFAGGFLIVKGIRSKSTQKSGSTTSNKRKILYIIIAIALILLFVFAGMYLGIFTSSSATTQSQPSSTTTATPSGGTITYDDLTKILFGASAALESILYALTPHSVSLSVGSASIVINSSIIEIVIAIVSLLFGVSLAYGLFSVIAKKVKR